MVTTVSNDYRQRQTIDIKAARTLAITNNTVPQMVGRTPRWLLHLLPWVQVQSGTYRVNRTKIVLKPTPKVPLNGGNNGQVLGSPEALRAVPMLSALDPSDIATIANRLQTQTYNQGETILQEGQLADKFCIVLGGNLEVVAKGDRSEKLQVAILGPGDYFGEVGLLDNLPSEITVRTLTTAQVLVLPKGCLDELMGQSQQLVTTLRRSLEERVRLTSLLNTHGEEKVALTSDYEGETILPRSFIDYETDPQEYELSIVQSILRVHTRVTDLYNEPIDQLREQLRLTIEGLKEQQEWEIINNPSFGLLKSTSPIMRVQPRYGVPTPDDFDNLLSLVWKQPAFFLAHPRAIAAFGRECTRRGVPPTAVNLYGSPFITWRGVPIIPCDKLEVKNRTSNPFGPGKTQILLMRVGEQEQGVVGLHQIGIPGEQQPSLSVRFMGIDDSALASYLLTLYFSCAVLTDDALAVLENVEVGYYHEYEYPRV